MRALTFVAPVVVLGGLVHLLLYGPRRAPVNSVRLSRRQWMIVAAVATPVLAVFAGLWASARLREIVTAHFGDDTVRLLILWSVSGLLGIVVGIAPARVEEPVD